MVEFDIFNLDDQQMNYQEEKKERSLFSPKPSDGRDNTYSAVIRFIPNPKDPYNKSWLKKVQYWIEAPELELKGYFDSVQSIGKDKDCILSKKYWELHNAAKKGDANAAKAQKRINTRKENYFSYVYILKDPQNTANEGKVMVFRYPKAIKKLIDKEKNPESVDGFETVESVEVFNLRTGKDFLLKITKQGDYPNYDECKFSSTRRPLSVGGKPITEKAAQAEFAELMKNRPILEDYDYKEWDEETTTKIKKFLANLSGSQIETYDELDSEFNTSAKDEFADDFDTTPAPAKKADTAPAKQHRNTAKEADEVFNESPAQSEFDEFAFDTKPEKPKAEPKKAESKKAEPKKSEEKKPDVKPPVTSGEADDLEDFLAGL